MASKQGKEGFDYLAKVAIIGDSAVGKTNILLRYINAEYHMSHIVTIGIDFKIKTVTLANNYKMKLQIWDTAGQERFRNLSGTIYQGASAIILAYSITSKKSFENVKAWVQDIQQKVHDKEYIFAIIGNKCDLEQQRQVTKEQGMAMAKQFGAKIFFQTSAKQNICIDQLFQRVAESIREKIRQKQGGSKPTKQQKRPESKSKRKNAPQEPKQISQTQSKVKLSTEKSQQKKKKQCC